MKKTIGLVALLSANVATADVNGGIRHIQTDNSNNTYTELELFYGVGSKESGVDVYTWVDSLGYKKYFGETIITSRKEFSLGGLDFRARGQITHNSFDKGPLSEYGFGVETTLPLPEKSPILVKAGYTPLFLDYNGNNIGRQRLDWFFITTKKLPLNTQIRGFGDIDYTNGHFEIPFSQIGVTVPVKGGFFVGAGVNFLGEGDMSPKATPFAELRYNFEF